MSDEGLHVVVATHDGLRLRFKQAYELGLAILNAGQRVELRVLIARDPIRVKQRKFLKDIVFGQISEQVRLDGQRYTKEMWAEHFRKEWLGSRFEEKQYPFEPEPRIEEIKNSTEELGVKGYAEYTDRVIAFAQTDLSVVFVFEEREREEVRYHERPARGAMQ